MTRNENVETSWDGRIKRALARGGFTVKDSLLSSDWCDCAVGEVCSIKPFGANEEDIQPELHQLGIRFHEAVRWNLPERALELLQAIRETHRNLQIEAGVGQ